MPRSPTSSECAPSRGSPCCSAGGFGAGADAIVFGLADFDEEDGELEKLHGEALFRELDCAIEVDDDETLEIALERVEPDIFAIASPGDDDGEAFERTLDVLPDVPAGKLVISESRGIVREQLLALERAGVDAILVSDLAVGGELRAALAPGDTALPLTLL